MLWALGCFCLCAQPGNPGQIEQDLARFESALASTPMDPGLRHDAGLACLWLGRFGDAARHFRAGLAVASGDAELWGLLGQAHRRIGELGEAVKALRQATVLQPREFEAWYQLGLALSDLGARPGSIEAFERALALNPKPAMVQDLHLYIGALALSNRDWARVDKEIAFLGGIAPAKAESLRRLRALGRSPTP